MMIYHHTKFSSEGIVKTGKYVGYIYIYIYTLTVTLNLKIAIFFSFLFLHDILTHDDAPPYQVWLQKAEQFRRYPLDKGRHIIDRVEEG